VGAGEQLDEAQPGEAAMVNAKDAAEINPPVVKLRRIFPKRGKGAGLDDSGGGQGWLLIVSYRFSAFCLVCGFPQVRLIFSTRAPAWRTSRAGRLSSR
jgi:hypothetical protein